MTKDPHENRDDESEPLRAPDRPTTTEGPIYFVSAARSAMESVVDDEQERRAQLEIDRYYRSIMSDAVEFGRRDARDLLVHRPEITEHWDDDERETDTALRGFIYDGGGRPDCYDFTDLSSVELQLTRLGRAALERWRAANAAADRDPDLELELDAAFDHSQEGEQ